MIDPNPWSQILVTAIFVVVVIMILKEVLNRAFVALIGALAAFFVLLLIENAGFINFIWFLFGDADDGFVNFHSLLLIFGMTVIVQIANDAGFFQFFAINMVKLTGGEAVKLMITLCFLTFVISAILNNILTVLIMIPLTITIARALDVDPQPYILTQAVLVNIGGTLLPISSIPNILISTGAKISFAEFFANVGVLSIVTVCITIMFFLFLFRKQLKEPEKRFMEVLADFSGWSFVRDRRLMIKSVVVLFATIGLLITTPSDVLSPDIIALGGALVLVVISKVKTDALVSKINPELFLYLMGIFVVSGAMEFTHVIDMIGTGLAFIGSGDDYLKLMIIMWVSAYLSANVDNIPITKILIPVVPVVMGSSATPEALKAANYALAFGANWGDNLTPMGDNVLVMNIAKQYKKPISTKDFSRLGFITTNIQLFIATIYFSFLFQPFVGLVLLVAAGGIIPLVVFLRSILAKRRGTKPGRREGTEREDNYTPFRR
nr:SLC13 family permease [Candidatus Sigynarchaeum springense]